jgi:hypothetical protein
MDERKLEVGTRPRGWDVEMEGFPLKVVPDWGKQVRRARGVCRLIDRHLDDEAYSRASFLDKKNLSPRQLCPERRVQLITELSAATHDLS